MEKDSIHRLIHRSVEIGIRKNDVGIFSAEFKSNFLHVGSGVLHDLFSCFNTPGKGNEIDIFMFGKFTSDRVAWSKDKVDNTLWNTGFLHQFEYFNGSQWRYFARFHDQCVTCGKRRCQFPRCLKQWIVPRCNLATDTNGFADELTCRIRYG